MLTVIGSPTRDVCEQGMSAAVAAGVVAETSERLVSQWEPDFHPT